MNAEAIGITVASADYPWSVACYPGEEEAAPTMRSPALGSVNEMRDRAMKPTAPSEEVVSEMWKLSKKLEAAGHPLAKLPEALAPCLGARSSKGWKQGLENVLFSLKPHDEIKVAAVLAHDTAFKEIKTVLNIAGVLSDFFSIDFKLVLAHWEHLSSPVTDEVFSAISTGIRFQLETTIQNATLIVIDRRSIAVSTPFVRAREEIWDRVHGTPCVEDFEWIVSFYGRQNSYRPQGMAQALHDFTMRRGIGLLIEEIDPAIALLTEMKERLSRCYRCPCPALNVKT